MTEQNKNNSAETEQQSPEEKKRVEAAKVREERIRLRKEQAKKQQSEDAELEERKKPSPNQPRLDKIVKIIRESVSEDAIGEAYINERDQHMPCLVVSSAYWLKTANVLKEDERLKLNYLRNVSGVDYESYLEVVYHLISLQTKDEYCIKVRTDKDSPSVPSVTPVWQTANWNEREIYDLLGIDFPGHPDLRRIMMPDDWVGHPLRKDYEPFDPEV